MALPVEVAMGRARRVPLAGAVLQLVSGDGCIVLNGTAAKLAGLLAEHQETVNALPTGSVELHWGSENASIVLHAQLGTSRPR